ncbi:hypothetical protein C8J56DRAFT_1037962 [Mycena floridula]|nr:hypothetical protein C8J56DRAFT_1037962 [Mycena floridula]
MSTHSQPARPPSRTTIPRSVSQSIHSPEISTVIDIDITRASIERHSSSGSNDEHETVTAPSNLPPMTEITGAFTILQEELETGKEYSVMPLATFYRFGETSDIAGVSVCRVKAVELGGPTIGKQWLGKAVMPSRRLMKEHLRNEFSQLDMLLTCPRSVRVGKEKTVVYSFDLTKYQQFQLLLFQLENRCQRAIQISGATMPPFPVWGEKGEGIEEEWWNANDYEILAVLYRIEVENWTAALEKNYDFRVGVPRLSITDKGKTVEPSERAEQAVLPTPPVESSASRGGNYGTEKKLFRKEAENSRLKTLQEEDDQWYGERTALPIQSSSYLRHSTPYVPRGPLQSVSWADETRRSRIDEFLPADRQDAKLTTRSAVRLQNADLYNKGSVSYRAPVPLPKDVMGKSRRLSELWKDDPPHATQVREQRGIDERSGRRDEAQRLTREPWHQVPDLREHLRRTPEASQVSRDQSGNLDHQPEQRQRANRGGDPDPSDDGSDDSGDGGRRPVPRIPERRNPRPPHVPDVNQPAHPIGQAFHEQPVHFDVKLKTDNVPTWDGNTDEIVRWITKVTDISKGSEIVFRQLGRIVPQRLCGAAERWYYSLPVAHRLEAETDWSSIKNLIAGYYMNHKWFDRMKSKANRASYRERGHERETPSEYFIRKNELLSTVYDLDASQIILDVMDGAPANWNTILNTQMYEDEVQFQLAI